MHGTWTGWGRPTDGRRSAPRSGQTGWRVDRTRVLSRRTLERHDALMGLSMYAPRTPEDNAESAGELPELPERDPARPEVLPRVRDPPRGRLRAIARPLAARRQVLRGVRHADRRRPAGRRRRGHRTTTPVAERRVVSVLFADLVGFTTAREGRDAEETRELLARYFESPARSSSATAGRSRSSSATR